MSGLNVLASYIQLSSDPKELKNNLKENYTFVLSMMVIVPFMIYFGVVLLVFKDLIMLEKMTALLAGFVAAVLGYFVGQKPAQEFAKQARAAERERDNALQRTQSAVSGVVDLTDEWVRIKEQIDEEMAKLKRLEGDK